MKRIIAILAMMTLLFVSVPSAGAQVSICSGYPALRVYENSGYGSPSWLICGGSLGVIQDSNLSNNTTNLGFGANWNDRITSLRTYNFPSNKKIRFYPSAGYSDDNTAGPDRTLTVTGNTSITNLKVYWANDFQDGFNDVISSFKTIP